MPFFIDELAPTYKYTDAHKNRMRNIAQAAKKRMKEQQLKSKSDENN